MVFREDRRNHVLNLIRILQLEGTLPSPLSRTRLGRRITAAHPARQVKNSITQVPATIVQTVRLIKEGVEVDTMPTKTIMDVFDGGLEILDLNRRNGRHLHNVGLHLVDRTLQTVSL